MSSLVDLDIAEQPAVLARVVDENRDALAHTRERIRGARVVRFLALGSSRHAAGYGSVAVDQLSGVPANVLPAPGWGNPLPPLSPDDVVFAVSQSGETPALVDAAADARRQGASVVAVTNTATSPLESVAHLTLRCGAGPERVVAATKSVTSTMLLLRAAASPVADDVVDRLVAGLMEALALDLSAALRRPVPSWIVCAGLTGDWVADEIALKLAELAGRVAAAEPLIEFLHGPIAAAGPVLALVEPSEPNASELVERPGVTVVRPPATGDPWVDAVITLVVGQRLAVGWAHAVGHDPDAPKGLEKITRSY